MTKRLKLTFVERPSPNFNDRNGQPIQFLIIHCTAMATAEDAIQRLCDPAAKVSAHYVVDEQGTVYRLVAEENRAWHAGVSYWDGTSDLNTSSIGIEIANPGDAPYPQAQMDAVIALSNAIVNRHKIRSFYVVGHSDIAPNRKQDPGEQFDWQSLSTSNLGVWPVPTQSDYTASATWTEKEVKRALVKVGYRPTLDQVTLLTAFQRHFQPDVFKTPNNVGIADGETKARLACLIRRKNISDAMRKRASRMRRRGKSDR
ncbi:N-acetylmuramoyl-L-alanine amidase [soil metagenome]